MSEDEGFLQAILRSPEDTALRLVYADWLEERGDSRAEFLRLLHQRAEVSARIEQLAPALNPEWVRCVRDRRATTIQLLPAPPGVPRVETGAVQFGNDWPGLFIRGDNASTLQMRIRQLEAQVADHADPDLADLVSQLTWYADMIEQDVII